VLEAVLVAVGEQVDVGQRLVVLGESAEGHDGADSP
ncbi:MAG: hypothetical protein JWP61_52, partial [Friedmanniella sp.]|nr:hypothetical protein [Friedmanniella sp.]